MIETEPVQSEVGEGGGERIDPLVELDTKSEMGQGGRESIDWLVEIHAKSEMPE